MNHPNHSPAGKGLGLVRLGVLSLALLGWQAPANEPLGGRPPALGQGVRPTVPPGLENGFEPPARQPAADAPKPTPPAPAGESPKPAEPPVAKDEKPPESAKPANPAPKPDAQPPPEITVNADTIEMFMEKGQAVFSGHVKATDAQLELRADRMTVFFDDKQQIKSIEAESNVVVEHEKGKARGGRAHYDLVAGIMRLFEKPVIEQPGSSIEGAEIVEYSRAEGIFRTKGGSVVLRITPKDPTTLAPFPALEPPKDKP